MSKGLGEYLEQVYNEIPVDIAVGKDVMGKETGGKTAVTFNIKAGNFDVGRVSIPVAHFKNGILTDPSEFRTQLQSIIEKNKKLFGGESISSKDIVAGIGNNRIKISDAVELEYKGGKMTVTPEGKA